MTLRPLATRVPGKLEKEIHDVMDFLNVEKAQAVRMILEIGISEWRKKTALELLRDGKVTFTKAARLAKLDLWDLADLIRDRRVEWVRTSVRELEEEAKKASKASVE
jgi:predicted HTH domain antitoxin